MKKIYIQIIFICFLSNLIANIPVNYNKIELKYSFLNSKSNTKNNNYKYPGKAMLYSAIVPGLGQIYNGNLKRALLFSIIEASCWTAYYINNEKSIEKKNEYINFANNEWSFENWMKHYYDWQDDNEYKILFSNIQSTDTLYENIWDGSHHLEFMMSHNGNVILMSTTDSDDSNSENPIFRDYFSNDFGTWIPDTTSINELINDPNFVLVKDSHYYENIFKYNHFYSGWSDSEEISIYDNDGYFFGTRGVECTNNDQSEFATECPIDDYSYYAHGRWYSSLPIGHNFMGPVTLTKTCAQVGHSDYDNTKNGFTEEQFAVIKNFVGLC